MCSKKGEIGDKGRESRDRKLTLSRRRKRDRSRAHSRVSFSAMRTPHAAKAHLALDISSRAGEATQGLPASGSPAISEGQASGSEAFITAA